MKCSLNSNFLVFKSSITDSELDDIRNSRQYFSDCYLMSSIETLSKTENGRKILKKQIQHDDENPNILNCYLYSPLGSKIRFAIPTDTAVKGYESVYKYQPNEIIRSMDISVNEYEHRYKSKPLICRIRDDFKDYDFEYNLPSNFMKMLTGKEPTVNIAETDFNINLTSRKDEVMELFKRMQTDKNHNLIIATGAKDLNGHRWHVYVLEDVDLGSNTITVKEKRGNVPQTLDIDKALDKFKYIVGYFDKDLE